MIKTIDILHYYMGSRFLFIWNDGQAIIAVLEYYHSWGGLGGQTVNGEDYEIDDLKIDGVIKLFLTHPKDMTERQKSEYRALCKWVKQPGSNVQVDTPLSLDYLFRNSIDAFDLIENGEAISWDYKPIELLPVALPESKKPEHEHKQDPVQSESITIPNEIKKPEIISNKNPDAVALGKLGGLKGGPARAEKLSPERRSEIAQQAAKARWEDESDPIKIKPEDRPPAVYSNNKSLYPELNENKSAT